MEKRCLLESMTASASISELGEFIIPLAQQALSSHKRVPLPERTTTAARQFTNDCSAMFTAVNTHQPKEHAQVLVCKPRMIHFAPESSRATATVTAQ